MNKPTITVRKALNFPDNIEVDLVWPGAYKTMLTFHKDDFENGNAQKLVEAHVRMIKRDIEYKNIKEEVALKVYRKYFGTASLKEEGAKIDYDK